MSGLQGEERQVGTMKVVQVTGSRTFDGVEARRTVWAELDRQRPDLVISGMARGVDRLAWEWAKSRKVECEEHPADWDLWGRSAGPRRNEVMCQRSLRLQAEGHEVVVLAWMVQGSRGTQDMVNRCRARHLDVTVWEV